MAMKLKKVASKLPAEAAKHVGRWSPIRETNERKMNQVSNELVELTNYQSELVFFFTYTNDSKHWKIIQGTNYIRFYHF